MWPHWFRKFSVQQLSELLLNHSGKQLLLPSRAGNHGSYPRPTGATREVSLPPHEPQGGCWTTTEYLIPVKNGPTVTKYRHQATWHCVNSRSVHEHVQVEEFTLDHELVQRYLKTLVQEYGMIQETLPNLHGAKEIQHLRQRSEELEPVVALVKEVERIKADVAELETWQAGTATSLDEKSNDELLKLISQDRRKCQEELRHLQTMIYNLIAPPEEMDSKDIILEVAAGVGGQEAMLFAKDMFKMYLNYTAWKGWQSEVLSYNTTEIGGLRNASMSITGRNACKYMKFEGGVHRVQRVPKTEKAGRIHTSTMTVAILPQPTEVDIVLHPHDLRIETKRASGAGGQHVNKTDSCVRILHIPTGIVAECQEQRSQIQNKEAAFKTLRARIYQKQLEEEACKIRSSRKIQVGTGARSEKVRTYNFMQDRITDHRISDNVYDVKEFLVGQQKLDVLLERLLKSSHTERLREVLRQTQEK